ncbi:Hsp20/alpha crystallin family protein [Acrocarpospora catenulata]|uniref:Hsp20/alpha crystallin family protein n=1 Tax=Acrocarpospora catenulata TaxID=2836182 RepID=UPI001BD986B9|nr:Hsp20/alpha crystallin family protein [Acrocarpospora catenulata]
MSTLMRRDRGFLPDVFDLLDMPLMGMRQMSQQPLRFEDYLENGEYVLRAELPGVDPDRDVEVTVSGGMLTIHAERHQEEKDAQRSEFRYGSVTRSVALPELADERDIKAFYDKGILEVHVKLSEGKQPGMRVPISTAMKESPEQGQPG